MIGMKMRPFPAGEKVEQHRLKSGSRILVSPKSDGTGYYVEGLRCDDILTRVLPYNFGSVRERTDEDGTVLGIRTELWSKFKVAHPEYAESVGYRSSKERGMFGVDWLDFC